jgi:dihydroneopterin aldolase
MPAKSCIELRDLLLQTNIGTYQAGEVVPSHHSLDLTLWIDPSLVLIAEDSMDQVFDYDPLIREIQRIAADGHYETQERLITRIVEACAELPVIEGVDIALCKFPVSEKSGSLGVRLSLDTQELSAMRKINAPGL